MSSELQQYPDHFDQFQPSLINGNYDIQMYSFNVEPEKILEWTADTENAKPVLKKLVQQNLGSKSIFFPSIERVIQDSVQALEKSYDVLHMYTYSDGWDDGHYQRNTKEVIPYSDAEIKWLKTVFSHPKIHSHVALFNTCDECKGLKRPIAMKHLRQVCAQIETPVSNMRCTFDEEPNPPSRSFWIEGDFCSVPRGTSLNHYLQKYTANCSSSNGLWYSILALLFLIGSVFFGFWWKSTRHRFRNEKIRQLALADRKSTVIFSEKPSTKGSSSTKNKITKPIEMKVSLINLNTMENIGNYSNLNVKKLLIGSHENCDVHLSSPFVSGEHLMIEFGFSTLSIKDLDSANGTMCNQTSLLPNVSTPIRNGTIIILGDVSLQVVIQ